MNNLQKTLLVAGAIGLGSAIAAPAFAGDVQAYASGSATLVLMNGASVSMGGEIAAPVGASFANTSVVVTPLNNTATPPTLNTNTAAGGATLASLTVVPGTGNGAGSPTASMEAAVATRIATAPTLEEGVSYTRAWQSGLQ